ncbi:MAG: DegT/DnrJ/EryC1/StrS family aminotransferase [Terriglobales bacterium]
MTTVPQTAPLSPAAASQQFAFLDLRAQFAGIRDEVQEAVLRVLEAQHFILGPEVEKFEAAVARYVGCSFAVGCASGSDALLLALMALGVDAGDEVITTPFTFVATAGAIARLKARPVFVDIDPETYNLDPRKLEAAITQRTRAIIPVHLFGQSAEMRPIMRVAGDHKLPVIEDAAQAIGAWYQGKPVGSIGAMGCFSFFPSKNLGGAGDGGMVTTDDELLAGRLKVLRVHGSPEKYHYELLGMNSRLDALQAAILSVKLRHLDNWTAARQRNAERYRRLFADAELDSWVQLPAEPTGRVHVYNQFVVRVQDRDGLRQYLRASGIPTEIYYPSPLHLQPAFAYLGYGPGDFPQAEAASRQTLALPIFAELDEAQQQRVVATMSAYYSGTAERKQAA